MSRTPRPIRQLAMQLLYQLDVSGDGARAEASAEASAEATAEELQDELALSVERAEHDPGPEARAQAAELAVQAWLAREQADALTGELAPQWPAYRQPPVDRAVLRLGIYEVASEREAAKRAINEAIDLAKRYGSKDSPGFVNALLDKVARKLGKLGPGSSDPPDAPASPESETAVDDSPADAGPGPGDETAWLDDALRTPDRS